MIDSIQPNIVSKFFIGWICFVCTSLTILLCNTSDIYKSFYRFGPHSDLIILGIQIDTNIKYSCIIAYSFTNSIFRTIFAKYLHPWMINNVQDEDKDKQHLDHYTVYEIAGVSVIYNWLDWLLYMNILLAQIDMMIIEVVGELLISYITTYYYLKTPKRFIISDQSYIIPLFTR